MIHPPSWLVRVVDRLADFADRLPPKQDHTSWLPGTEGIEYIGDDAGDRLIFHPDKMPPYRQYFTWDGVEYAAFVDRGEVAVVREEDLRPRQITTVWCDDWRVA